MTPVRVRYFRGSQIINVTHHYGLKPQHHIVEEQLRCRHFVTVILPIT
jgi:hypothetical protein